MKTVGVRKLKNHLSEYLRQVRAGEDILVTDRGQVIAELCRPHRDERGGVAPGIARLARQGRLWLGEGPSPELYPPFDRLTAPGAAQRLLDAEREER